MNRPKGVVRRYDLEIAQGAELEALAKEVETGRIIETDADMRERVRQLACARGIYVDDMRPPGVRAFVDPMGRTFQATGKFQRGLSQLHPREFEVLAVLDAKPADEGRRLVHRGCGLTIVVDRSEVWVEFRCPEHGVIGSGADIDAIEPVDAPPVPSASVEAGRSSTSADTKGRHVEWHKPECPAAGMDGVAATCTCGPSF